MRSFFKYFALLSAILFIGSFFLDSLISQGLKKSKSNYYYIWNDLLEGKINADIVIYGSSRARLHIDPKVLEDSLKLSVYNLGIDGYNFDMIYARHQLLLRRNTQPKAIIFSLDYFTLEKRADLFNSDQFLPYLNDTFIQIQTQKYKGLSWADYHLPFLRYVGRRRVIREGAQCFFEPSSWQENIYKGYQASDKKWNDSLLHFFKKPTDTILDDLDPHSIKAFEAFIQECKNKNIQLICIYSPEYILGQKHIKQRASRLAYFEEICKTHQILYIDYSNLEICSDKNLFYNTQHLNHQGALLFSKKLSADLKKLPGNLFHKKTCLF